MIVGYRLHPNAWTWLYKWPNAKRTFDECFLLAGLRFSYGTVYWIATHQLNILVVLTFLKWMAMAKIRFASWLFGTKVNLVLDRSRPIDLKQICAKEMSARHWLRLDWHNGYHLQKRLHLINASHFNICQIATLVQANHTLSSNMHAFKEKPAPKLQIWWKVPHYTQL